MVASITDRYVAATGLDDALGTGLRLHTDHDEVYELREAGKAAVRVYGEEGEWTVKARFQETDLDPAYDRFDAIAETLEDAYGENLITSATYFLNEAKHGGSVETTSGPITLRYNERDADGLLTIDDMGGGIPAGPDILVGLGYAGTGLAGGAAAGAAAAGPEGMMVGGVGGMVAGFAGFFKELNGFPRSPIGYSIKGMKNTRKRVQRRRERKKTRADRLEEYGLWDTLNEANRLETVAETTRDLDEARRHEELQETGITETVDALMDHHFDSFHERQGVTATATTDSYREALDFAATVLDRETPGHVDHGHPTIYRDPLIFRDLFEAAHKERREELVATVLDVDTAGPVEEYLDSHHEDIVRDIGGTTRLEEGTDGGRA